MIIKFALSLPDEIKKMCQLLMEKIEAMMSKGFIYLFLLAAPFPWQFS